MATNYWSEFVKFFGHDGIELKDGTRIIRVQTDPSAGAGQVAVNGSLAIQDSKLFKKTGGADTAWTEMVDQDALDAVALLITDHIADTTDAHAASAITNTPSGNLVATDVQGALNELQDDIDAHLIDAVDAHDASAISVLDTAAIYTADNTEDALAEVKTQADATNVRTANIAPSTNLNLEITDKDGTHIFNKESEVRSLLNFKEVAPTTEYTASGGTVTGTVANEIVAPLDGYRSAKVTTVSTNQGTKFTSSVKTSLQPKDFQLQAILVDWQYDSNAGNYNLVIEESTDGVTYTENARLQLPKELVSDTQKLHFKLKGTATHYRHYFEMVGETVGAIARWDNVKVITNPLNFKEVIETQEYTITQASTSMLSTTNELEFNLGTATITDDTSIFIEAVDDAGNTRTKFTAKRDCVISGVSSAIAASNRGLLVTKNGTVLIAGNTTSGTGDYVDADIDMKLSAGEFFTVASMDTGRNISTSAITGTANVTITATATQSQAVVKGHATDTEWTSYTPVFQGFGPTPTAIDFWYRRVGDSIELRGKFNSDISTAVEAQIGLPSGLNIKTSELVKISGSAFRDKAVVTAKSFSVITTGGDSFLNLSTSHYDIGLSPLTPDVGTNIALSGETITLYTVSIPIQGWSVTDPMITFPVTNDVENVYSAKFAPLGAPIVSQSANAFSNPQNVSTGINTVDITNLGLTLPPAVEATTDLGGGSATATATKDTITITTTNSAGGASNVNYDLVIQRQGADYKAPQGGFLANVAPTKHVTGGTEYPLPSETINGVQKYSRKFLATGSFSAPFTIATTVTGLDVENIIVIARRSDGIWLKPNMSGTTRYLVHYADTTGVVYFDRASDTWTDVKVEIQYK